jgi:carbonic anhydrase
MVGSEKSEESGSRTGTVAVDLLRTGNARFLGAVGANQDAAGIEARLARANPYAIVLGCSDSRVPPEIVFDESVGRLFVIRVAASLAGSAEIGTIEFGLARWGCPLLVVLGHSQCSAVAAAMDRLPPGADPSPKPRDAANLASLVGSIHANVGWIAAGSFDDPWLEAVRRNVRRTMEQLVTGSPLIRRRVEDGRLLVGGAIYHVETGAVEFLDPEAAS